MILIPALIFSALISILLGAMLAQIHIQSKIVQNYQNSWLILHSLENDLSRFLSKRALLTSTLTKIPDAYLIADKTNPHYKIRVTIDDSSVPAKIKTWSFSNS